MIWWLLGFVLVAGLVVVAVYGSALTLPELREVDAIEHARPSGNVDLLPRL